MGVAFTADRGDAGVRVDLAVLRHLPPSRVRSRTRVQRLVAGGAIEVNGRVVRRASTRLAPGDHVLVAWPDAHARQAPVPQAIRLAVLFEDEWLIAVNKPPGLIVHPSYKHPDHTLINALVWHARMADPASEAPRLLHRLDKWTSGVVVAARSGSSYGPLLTAMRAADAEKAYLAVTYRGPRRRTGAIRFALGRDAHDRRRVVASTGDGRESLTRYECVARTAGARRGLSLLQCRLVTGRMHQIRVHLSASGWPIVGDPFYGSRGWERIRDPHLAEVARQFPRQALHAWRVRFTHPFTGERLSIVAGVPDDLGALLDAGGFDPRLTDA